MSIALEQPLSLISPGDGPLATIDTPLGSALTFHAMAGIEGLSRPFAYEVDVVSTRSDIAASELLGQSVTVHLSMGDDDDDVRHWNGRVTELQYIDTSDDGDSRYRLSVRPWFWQLTRSADCRIFQNMSIPEIVMQVFKDRGFTDFDRILFEDYPQREYVVQYRETDFQFVSRLLEREGIYYFFRHQNGKHTLVLADSPQAHSASPGCEQLPYAPDDEHRDATQQYMRRWKAESRLETGVYGQADYDFTKPRVALFARATASDSAASRLEVYDYPGGFDNFPDADAYARLRLDQSRRDAQRWTGETNARTMSVGSTFKLTDHPRDEQNKSYLVTWARYRIKGQDARSTADDADPVVCTLVAIDAETTFRPPLATGKPNVRGPQTAMVVGPSGQEIWTDQYGRVKVQFPWDRLGQNDEGSSCWVRVSQPWAGSSFGAQFIPRIGHEVVVDFLEGDPDRPIIVGSMYNGSNSPAFELPENQTQSGIRTRSTPGGMAFNGNEIRFEDMKGAEELFVQAERDHRTVVKGSQTTAVALGRSISVGGAETMSIGLTRSLQVGAASTTTVGAGSTETVGGLRNVIVGGQSVVSIAQGSNVQVGGDAVTHVGGAVRCDLAGSLTISAVGKESRTTGGELEVRVSEGASYVYASELDTVVGHPDREAALSSFVYGPLTLTTSKDITLESDKSLTLKCGTTTVVITADGVTINGKTLELDAGSKLAVSSPNASVSMGDDVTVTAKNVTVSSSGAQLALSDSAKLVGSKVQLGSGSGASASSSGPSSSPPPSDKPVFLRTKILRNGKPAAGVSYTLTLDGGTQLSGTTTGAGLVEQKVPATVATAELVLQDTGEKRTFSISAIEPVDTTLGAQQRLARLGYYHGALDGTAGPLFMHALQAFQKAQGLDGSGALDGATQGALKKAYGS